MQSFISTGERHQPASWIIATGNCASAILSTIPRDSVFVISFRNYSVVIADALTGFVIFGRKTKFYPIKILAEISYTEIAALQGNINEHLKTCAVFYRQLLHSLSSLISALWIATLYHWLHFQVNFLFLLSLYYTSDKKMIASFLDRYLGRTLWLSNLPRFG